MSLLHLTLVTLQALAFSIGAYRQWSAARHRTPQQEYFWVSLAVIVGCVVFLILLQRAAVPLITEHSHLIPYTIVRCVVAYVIGRAGAMMYLSSKALQTEQPKQPQQPDAPSPPAELKIEILKQIVPKNKATKNLPTHVVESYAAHCAAEYEYALTQKLASVDDPETAIRNYSFLFKEIADYLPANLGQPTSGDFTARLLDLVQDPKKLFTHLLYGTGLKYNFERARAWTVLMQGVDLYDDASEIRDGRTPSWITKYEGTIDQAAEYFLYKTVWKKFLETEVSIPIPESARRAHHYVTGGSDHGKTTLLKQLIARDLRTDATVIVVDSQDNIIPDILKLDIPKERYLLIDPTLYVPALNFFDHGVTPDDPNYFSKINSLITLYNFMLAALMEQDMSDKMKVAFSYAIQMFAKKQDATLRDLPKLFSADGVELYRQWIDQMSETAQDFFYKEFKSTDFRETRQAVSWRIHGFLNNPFFDRMFSTEKSRIDLRTEIETPGKIILINTAPRTLGRPPFKFFGRLWIGLALQAIQERDPNQHNRSVWLYIDEAQEYADETIEDIMLQARKFGMGLILANQNFGKLPEGVRRAIASSTSIKMAGGIDPSDARPLSDSMNTDWRSLTHQRQFHFVTFIKNHTNEPIVIHAEPGLMGKLPKRSDLAQLKQLMRDKYEAPNKTPSKQVSPDTAIDPDAADVRPQPKTRTKKASRTSDV